MRTNEEKKADGYVCHKYEKEYSITGDKWKFTHIFSLRDVEDRELINKYANFKLIEDHIFESVYLEINSATKMVTHEATMRRVVYRD